MSSRDVETRLAAFERRLGQVEDELTITRLVLAYGPLVDSGSAAAVAGLWAEDGSYEFQADVPPLIGRDGMEQMVDGAAHHRHLSRGCAHVLTAPHVKLAGDRAVATCYSLMHHFVPDTGSFRVSRVSSNRWEFARQKGQWLVTRRTNRLLNGSDDARALLARMSEDNPDAAGASGAGGVAPSSRSDADGSA